MKDIVIVGGGACGCSLLYALSQYDVQALLLEKENDVGVGTTKANSAIVHAGYDPAPGTLMAKYNVWGNRLIAQLCADLDIPFSQTGSLVIGFTPEDAKTIQDLYARGIQNGVPDLRILNKIELHKMEPSLNSAANIALYAPTAAVVNPWELASAQAEVAVQNGAEVWLDTAVSAIEKTGDHFTVRTTAGDVAARYVVNAAGVYAAEVSRMAEGARFSIQPSRGQYFLLDTTQGTLVRHIVFQCPSPAGKGVLVAPTVHGNLIVGPNAEPVPDENLATTADGLAFVRGMAVKSVPDINFRESIRNFAGVRAVADTGDFIVGPSPTVPGFFNIAGIKSPGLTCAPAIAQDMLSLLSAAGLPLPAKAGTITQRHVIRFKHLSAADKNQKIAKNPQYGQIVCRCETITEGEIVDALHRPLPPRSLDAVKRRCNPGMGRCQGGFCGPRVQAIIAREAGLAQSAVPLDRPGSTIILGETKTGPISTENAEHFYYSEYYCADSAQNNFENTRQNTGNTPGKPLPNCPAGPPASSPQTPAAKNPPDTSSGKGGGGE